MSETGDFRKGQRVCAVRLTANGAETGDEGTVESYESIALVVHVQWDERDYAVAEWAEDLAAKPD